MADEESTASPHPLPAQRIVIALVACAAFLALDWVPLPGLSTPGLTLGLLGLWPILGAFIAVELVAALVPGLRPLRANAEGRIRLRRIAFGLAILIALAQAYQLTRYARALHALEEPTALHPWVIDPRLVIPGALVLSVVLMAALARLIDVAGVGVGFSLLIATSFGASFVRVFAQALQHGEEDPPMRALLLLGLFALASWKMLATPPREGTRALYRLPTSGLEPVHQAVVLVVLGLNTGLAREFFWPYIPASFNPWILRGLQLLLTLGLCQIFSHLFHRPAIDEDKLALARANRASMLWLAGLTIGSWILHGTLKASSIMRLDPFQVVTLVAVGMDLVYELRVCSRTGPQRQLRVLHRLEDADALAAALGSAGILSALRGAHHRSLYQFFAPFIPIGVLVPEREAEQAEVVAVEHERAMAEPPPLPAALTA